MAKKQKEDSNVVRRSLQEVVGKGYATFWNFKGLECYLPKTNGWKR